MCRCSGVLRRRVGGRSRGRPVGGVGEKKLFFINLFSCKSPLWKAAQQNEVQFENRQIDASNESISPHCNICPTFASLSFRPHSGAQWNRIILSLARNVSLLFFFF